MKILVVDDEPQIRRALRTSLEAHGHEVTTVGTGEEGVVGAAEIAPDLVLLDLGLPDMDGTEVIRRVRAFSDVPIIVLSVRETQRDKVLALDAGADDYVTKPFGMEELLARARAAMRRVQPETTPSQLRFGSLSVDLVRRLVVLDGEQVHLTPTEYGVLEAVAPANGLGPGVRLGDDVPSNLRPRPPEEARRRRLQPEAHHHRARGRIPVDR
jgi:two-component system, OmpR family, KDP operon response regulator KdpE